MTQSVENWKEVKIAMPNKLSQTHKYENQIFPLMYIVGGKWIYRKIFMRFPVGIFERKEFIWYR